jgi:Kae1-associated kinase Bud32
MIYQGAEAKIIRSTYHDLPVICKKRIQKRYRLSEIDDQLIGARTKEEAKLMGFARTQGVPVPIIFDIDVMNGIIIMQFLDGARIKDIFDDISKKERKELCLIIGETIAKLHNKDIIHGDITTSNMIYQDGKVYLIDFGLGEINPEVETKGVDLHVLMEAIESTHSQHASDFSWVLEGYRNIYMKNADEVLKKIDEIVQRGRYR